MRPQIDWQETTEDIQARADRLLTEYICNDRVPINIRHLLMEASERGYRPWIELSRSWEFPFLLEKMVSGCSVKLDVFDISSGTVMLSPRIQLCFMGKEMEVTAHMCEFNSISLLEEFVTALQMRGLGSNEAD